MAFTPKLLQQGAGGGLAKNYIEDVFSTDVYVGSNSQQTITNGINLATKGGMIWIKSRDATTNHFIADSSRKVGANYQHLRSNTTDEQQDEAQITSLNSNGFTLGGNYTPTNRTLGGKYVSWTFRKQPKFFDIVTYTGTGVARAISHNLGSVPGCMIVKKTSGAENWLVYHRSLGSPDSNGVLLNTTAQQQGPGISSYWNNTLPISTQFTVGTNDLVNQSGATYVAYLFAHDAGGFGESGNDNVISCGSFTTDGSGGATINLGYEPQWFLHRKIDGTGSDWELADVMRKFTVGSGNSNLLYPNSTSTEAINQSVFSPTSTGVTAPTNPFEGSVQYIYIAIRRGPMKVPTVGTSVYNANIFPANSSTNNTVINPGFPVDLVFMKPDKTGDYNWYWQDRLRGQKYLYSNATNAEVNSSTAFDYSNGYVQTLTNGTDGIGWSFRRAPSVFDVVCYTGTGSARTVTHNLGAVPELMIVKSRSNTANWPVYASASGATNGAFLDDTSAFSSRTTFWNSTAPTSSVFTVGTSGQVNDNAVTYVAYLFATCAGVSKVGTYTGTGTTQTIDCGFTGGARFVLIKRTDSTGAWYVWDTARGIVSGNDPYSLLNSDVAEVTNTDYVDTYSAGFEISSTAPAAINNSGGSYIFLAIA